jgi:outer membrane protein assembly factor BamD (BamD/ComL family)
MNTPPPHRSTTSLGMQFRAFFWKQQLAEDQETLARANRWASADQFPLAVQILDNLTYRWESKSTAWERWWRRWQSQPVADRVAQLRPIWQQAIDDCQQELVKGQQAAARGDFQLAASQASLALSYCQQESAEKLQEQAQQAIQCQTWFSLGLAAEAAGNWETARYHYQNILEQLALPPRSTKFCRDRLLQIALHSEDWDQVIQLTAKATDRDAAKYSGLVQLKQQQHQQLAALKKIQASFTDSTIETAHRSVEEYSERFGHDPQLQAALAAFIQSQGDYDPQDWPSRCRLAQSQWLGLASPAILHDWAVAAYYRTLGAPDRLDWLSELLSIWVTALLNFHLEPPLIQLPWFDKLTEPFTITGLVESIAPLVDSATQILRERVTDEEQRRTLQLQWQRELLALEWLGSPPSRGVRVRGNFLSPGFYERFRDKLQVGELPAKQWATLYTPWWRAILACLEGQMARVMREKPSDKPQTAADTYGAQFVAFHEGCYYLKSQNESFARWREAVPHLKLAKPLILADDDWREQVDLLCDRHHALIWKPEDRQAFGDFWHGLLQSSRSSFFLDLVADELAE